MLVAMADGDLDGEINGISGLTMHATVAENLGHNASPAGVFTAGYGATHSGVRAEPIRPPSVQVGTNPSA
jgi:hypothetical protein